MKTKITLLSFFLLFSIILQAQQWEALGPDDFEQASTHAVGNLSHAINSEGVPFIAYSDKSNGYKITVKQWTGMAWVIVGSPGFSDGNAAQIKIAIDPDDNLYVAYADLAFGYKVAVKKWDGFAWNNIGTPGFSSDGVDYLNLAIDPISNFPSVAYTVPDINSQDASPPKLASVKQWNGNSWESLGDEYLTTDFTAQLVLVFDFQGIPYIAYSSQKGFVKKWDGNVWLELGTNGFSNANAYHMSISFKRDGTPFIAFKDQDSNSGQDGPTLKSWDGDSWESESSHGLSVGQAFEITLKNDISGNADNFYIAYQVLQSYGPDGKANYKAQVENLVGGEWFELGTEEFSESSISLLSFAMGPSGIPYIAFKEEIMNGKAVMRKWSEIENLWAEVGSSGFSDGKASSISIAYDQYDNAYIGYAEGIKNKATVRRWDGQAWTVVGNAHFSAGIASNCALAFDPSDGVPYLAYSDAGTGGYDSRATVQKLDEQSNEWVYVGAPGFSNDKVSHLSIAYGAKGLFIAYTDYADVASSRTVVVKKLNSSNWVDITPLDGFLAGKTPSLALDVYGSPIVAYSDGSNEDMAMVKKWDGVNWLDVGQSGISQGRSYGTALTVDADDNLFVAYKDLENRNSTTVRTFDGNEWTTLGREGFGGSPQFISIEISPAGTPIIGYIRLLGIDLGFVGHVKKWNGTYWADVSSMDFYVGSIKYLDISVNTLNELSIAYSLPGAFAKKIELSCKPPTPDIVNLPDIIEECKSTPPTPTATNSCGDIIEATHNVTLPISTPGTTIVTWTYDDGNGNTVTQTQNIIIEDITPPVITCPADIEQSTDAGICDAIVTITEPTAVDNCTETVIFTGERSDGLGLANPYPVGDTTITWIATDDVENDSEPCMQTITITDDEAPEITCPVDITQTADLGLCGAKVTIIDPTATDNCTGTIIFASERSDGLGLANPYPVGDTTITWTATDEAGNDSDPCMQTITITDDEDPVIACVEDDSRYIDPYQTYYTVQGIEFDATATDNCDVATIAYTGGSPVTSGSSMDRIQLSLGDNSMEWTAIDVNDNESDCTTVVEVLKRPTLIMYNGDLDEQYSDQVELSAILTDDVSGDGVHGKTITFTIGSQTTTAITDVNGVASTVLILTQDPNFVYQVKAEFTEDASYLGSSRELGFDITQEDAIVEYTGQSLQATPGSNSSEAVVVLSANIQDISVTDFTNDPNAGDIRNAKVMFVNRDNGSPISGWLPVNNLVDPSDNRTGTVTYHWTVDIGNQDSQSFTVGIIVDTGYYYRNSSEDDTLVTVYVPVGDFITGGGYIIPYASAGQYASTDGLKTNFGFNVKYNKKGKKLKGHMNIIFRRLESDGIVHIYQIKSNAVESLGVDTSDETEQFATFITKSNLTDVTDPLYPASLGGNLTLKADMTDRGEPGVYDSIAFTLTNADGTLLYSTNWTGISTGELVLSGGNLVVHSGFSVNARGTGSDNDPVVEINLGDTFEVKTWPVPSDNYFNIKVTSGNDSDKVKIQVFDIRNQLVHFNEFSSDEQYQFGENLQSGLYFVRVGQGNNAQVLRVIKY